MSQYEFQEYTVSYLFNNFDLDEQYDVETWCEKDSDVMLRDILNKYKRFFDVMFFIHHKKNFVFVTARHILFGIGYSVYRDFVENHVDLSDRYVNVYMVDDKMLAVNDGNLPLTLDTKNVVKFINPYSIKDMFKFDLEKKNGTKVKSSEEELKYVRYISFTDQSDDERSCHFMHCYPYREHENAYNTVFKKKKLFKGKNKNTNLVTCTPNGSRKVESSISSSSDNKIEKKNDTNEEKDKKTKRHVKDLSNMLSELDTQGHRGLKELSDNFFSLYSQLLKLMDRKLSPDEFTYQRIKSTIDHLYDDVSSNIHSYYDISDTIENIRNMNNSGNESTVESMIDEYEKRLQNIKNTLSESINTMLTTMDVLVKTDNLDKKMNRINLAVSNLQDINDAIMNTPGDEYQNTML